MLKIVIVNLDVSGNGASSIKINCPSADPFSSPIALKVEIVARDFYLKLRAISLSIDCKFSCSLFVEQREITVHGLNYLIT